MRAAAACAACAVSRCWRRAAAYKQPSLLLLLPPPTPSAFQRRRLVSNILVVVVSLVDGGQVAGREQTSYRRRGGRRSITNEGACRCVACLGAVLDCGLGVHAGGKMMTQAGDETSVFPSVVCSDGACHCDLPASALWVTSALEAGASLSSRRQAFADDIDDER